MTYLVRELFEGGSGDLGDAGRGGFVSANDVAQRRRHHEILLLQTQLFPFEHLRPRKKWVTTRTGRESVCRSVRRRASVTYVVIGIEDARDILGGIAAEDGLDVVAVVEVVEVEVLGGVSGPEQERVAGVVAVAGHRVVIRQRHHDIRLRPSTTPVRISKGERQ